MNRLLLHRSLTITISTRDKPNETNNDKPPQPTYKTPAGLSSLFGQVDSVKSTMAHNMEAVIERGAKLEQLEDTSREMMSNAESLANRSANKKKK